MSRERTWKLGTIVELSARGYGFITDDSGSQRVFFHFRAVELPGALGKLAQRGTHRLDGRMQIGERVRWIAGKDAGKGPRAELVKLLTPEEKLVVNRTDEPVGDGEEEERA